MNAQTLEQKITDLADPIVKALGLDIWGVEVAQAGRTVLRLFVDVPSPAGEDSAPADAMPDAADQAAEEGPIPAAMSASIDQCEEISRHLGLALEVEDVMPDAYVLEVSTPGLSRRFFRLEQMRPYLDDMVEARLHTAFEGRRIWRGRLLSVDGEDLQLAPASISPDGDILPEDVPPVRLPWESVRRATRIHIFRQPTKPGKKPARPSAASSGKASSKGKQGRQVAQAVAGPGADREDPKPCGESTPSSMAAGGKHES